MQTNKPVKLLGTVVRRLISANQGLNCDLDFFIPLFKSLSWIIFSLLRRTFNHQIVHEKNCIGLSFKAFTSEIRFPLLLGYLNPALNNEKPDPGLNLQSKELTLYTLTSVCIFSILFPIHFLGCWQGELVDQSREYLVGDHFLYSHDLTVWCRGYTVGRN